jgi:hypothetical protein
MGHDASHVELAYLEFKTAQALYHKRFAVLGADERTVQRDWLRGLLAEGNTEARRKPVSGPD